MTELLSLKKRDELRTLAVEALESAEVLPLRNLAQERDAFARDVLALLDTVDSLQGDADRKKKTLESVHLKDAIEGMLDARDWRNEPNATVAEMLIKMVILAFDLADAGHAAGQAALARQEPKA